jgi:tRNA-splicing ligase RtcB (3'-phosphate/5'-hydroxy nucleic acid ligase)
VGDGEDEDKIEDELDRRHSGLAGLPAHRRRPVGLRLAPTVSRRGSMEDVIDHPCYSVLEIEEARLRIYTWATDLEEGALAQAINCANLGPAFHHVAVMADGHQGYGVPIGAVLALSDALSPYAVGNDIGCGMALVPTRLSAGEFLAPLPTRSGAPGPAARDELMGWVQSSIPAGSERRAEHSEAYGRSSLEQCVYAAFDAMEEAATASGTVLSASTSTHADPRRPLTRDHVVARAAAQAGTLGSGNHFIEVLAGEDDDVWVLVHSGSRGFGGTICANFHRMALAHCAETGVELPDPGLAWLPVANPRRPQRDQEERWADVGRNYGRAMRAALDYAETNRHRMLETVAQIFERHFPASFDWDNAVNIHHNDATYEEHFGQWVWVHRKGAVKATQGTATITPGSMGTGSVLGRGLGSPASFCSAAHGAGRALSRTRARKQLSLQAELAAIEAAGGKVFASGKSGVLDEMPGAYKDLEVVISRQADLVVPVRRFRPLATYKGSDRPTRQRRRADEEG